MLQQWSHHLAAVGLLLSLLLPAYAQRTPQPSSTVDIASNPNPFDLDNDSDTDPSITTLLTHLNTTCTTTPSLARACTACGLSNAAFFTAYTTAWSASCSGTGIGADADGCKLCEPGTGYSELDTTVDAGCAKMVFINWTGRHDTRAAERLCLTAGGEMRVVVVEEAVVEGGVEEVVEGGVKAEERKVPTKGIFLPGEEIPPEAMEGGAGAREVGWWGLVGMMGVGVWMGVME